MPYDVIDAAEARALARGLPFSFLHVVRPEIDLPEAIDEHDDAVYAKARENLDRFIADAPFRPLPGGRALLVYRLTMDGRAQTGIVGGCAVEAYDRGDIVVHERTRKDKEDDRTRHVVTMECQAEPIFLAYRKEPAIDRIVSQATEAPPRFDFVAADGVRHTVWTVPDPRTLAGAFEAVPKLYVADGHHRAKSASRARELFLQAGRSANEDAPWNRVLAVVFPHDQLRILPYNRVITDLRGEAPESALARLGARFPLAAGLATPSAHTVSVFGAGRWQHFRLPPTGRSPVDDLDVSLLQDRVLAPLFGVEDPRTDKKIAFVGGIRGNAELERRATESNGLAFAMHETSLDELFAVADASAIMPPKSTWFEPKLRSGLFIHPLREDSA